MINDLLMREYTFSVNENKIIVSDGCIDNIIEVENGFDADIMECKNQLENAFEGKLIDEGRLLQIDPMDIRKVLLNSSKKKVQYISKKYEISDELSINDAFYLIADRIGKNVINDMFIYLSGDIDLLQVNNFFEKIEALNQIGIKIPFPMTEVDYIEGNGFRIDVWYY